MEWDVLVDRRASAMNSDGEVVGRTTDDEKRSLVRCLERSAHAVDTNEDMTTRRQCRREEDLCLRVRCRRSGHNQLDALSEVGHVRLRVDVRLIWPSVVEEVSWKSERRSVHGFCWCVAEAVLDGRSEAEKTDRERVRPAVATSSDE